MNVGRLTLAAAAAGGLGVAAGGVALAHEGHSVAAAAPTGAASTGVQGVQAAASGLVAQSGGRGWRGQRGGGFDRMNCGIDTDTGTGTGTGAAGQVTAVNINGGSGTINLTSWRSTPATVTVSATTVYTQAQVAATSADVHVGSRILACGTGGSTNVQASQVYIILPRVAGVVTNVNGSTLTLTGFDGRTSTVTVGDSTTYDQAGQKASLADIKSGTAISAQGTQAGNGALNAVRVEIQVPRVAGKVTTVSGSTITLSSPRGGTTTVVTSPQTTYSAISGTATTANAVTANTYIIAQGPLSSDGKTLNALRIIMLPATANGAIEGRRGHGGHGFWGRGFGGGNGSRSGGFGGGNGSRSGGFGGSFGGSQGGLGGSGQAPSGTPNSGFSYHSAGGWNGASPDSGSGSATANA